MFNLPSVDVHSEFESLQDYFIYQRNRPANMVDAPRYKFAIQEARRQIAKRELKPRTPQRDHIRLIDGVFYVFSIGGRLIDQEATMLRARCTLNFQRRLRRTVSIKQNYVEFNGIRVSRGPNCIIELQDKVKEQMINLSKKPKNKKRHLGLELEFFTSSVKSDVKDTLKQYGLAQYVELGSDGSINPDPDSESCDGSCRDSCLCYTCDDFACSRIECDCPCELDENGDLVDEDYCQGHSCDGRHYNWDCDCECNCSPAQGMELRVCVPQIELVDVVTRVTEALKEHDADVNKTCGFHVHLDMRGRDKDKAYNNLFMAQDLLFAMQPRSRQYNQYCQRNIASTIEEQGRNFSRYHAINTHSLNEHKTIEVRLHSGTINKDKIIAWCELLVSIIQAKEIKTKISNYTQLRKVVRLTPLADDYVRERILTFTSNKGLNRINFSTISRRAA